MPSPSLTDEQLKQAIELVEDALRNGARPKNMVAPGRSAISVACEKAVELGLVKKTNTFKYRIEQAIAAGFEPDWSLYAPPRYQQPMAKSAVFHALPPDPEKSRPTSKGERVLVIGDLHQDPRHPHRVEVMKWIARFGAEQKYKYVVQIGDWGTFDSVSFHDRNDTAKGRLKPTITMDMDNLQESLKAWHTAKGDWKPIQKMTLGNHENRIRRFQDLNPELGNSLQEGVETMFMQWGWRTIPFAEIMYIEGVGFTHHPVNGAGRAYGGKLGITRATNEATCSLISGHTHNLKYWPAPKIGATDGIEHLEVGCAIPHGEVEHYALHGLTNWWHGVVEVWVCEGRIMSFKAHSLLELEMKYA